jgi:MFS family permease
MLPPEIFAPAQFRAANAVTFVVNGALGGFAFVFIPALEIVAGYSPVVAGSALVPVTVMTLLLSGASGRLAQRIGPRPLVVAGCLVCAVASMLAVRIGSHAGRVRLRCGDRRHLHHRTPPHPGTRDRAHPNPGAPPRLPGRLRPRTGTIPQTGQQPN